jgi:hypothetical protein
MSTHWLARLHLLRLQLCKQLVVHSWHLAHLHRGVGHGHFFLQERCIGRVDLALGKGSNLVELGIPAVNLALDSASIHAFEQQLGDRVQLCAVLVRGGSQDILVDFGLVDGLGVESPGSNIHQLAAGCPLFLQLLDIGLVVQV